MSREIVKDSTNVIQYIVIRDSVTGVLETGFDVTTLDFQYTRTGEAPSVKQDVTALAATDSDHADNKAIEIDATNSPGLCRVDFPDAAFATGVDAVILSVTGAGFDISPKEISLVDGLLDKWVNNQIVFDDDEMRLLDDDDVTILKTWVLSEGSLSVSGPYNRAKAT